MKRLLVIFLLLVAIAVASSLVGIWLAGKGGRGPLAGERVLTWRLHQRILDYLPPDTLPFLDVRYAQNMGSLYRALSSAREDESVVGLAVYLQDVRCGLAKAQELRDLMTGLRQAGKFVDCYLETAGEGGNGTLDYYLATACDHVALAPVGEMNLIGLYSASQFYRGTLEKLHIDPDFAHVGRYKSAGETYTERQHTPAAEEAITAVLDDFFQQIVTAIADARKLGPEEVRSLIDQAPYSADEALATGLVDELLYPDEFEERIEERGGGAARLPVVQYAREAAGRGGEGRVGVLFAQGTILRGHGGLEPWSDAIYLGSDEIGAILETLAEDDSVDAVVLRVDSPGGSALASDLILRQVSRVADAKPLIVSMSDVAASGGYYISARARSIVAQPATITGSIGVVGGKLVTRRFQEDLLGISYDVLERGENADIYSSLEPFTPAQASRYQELMERVYDTFLEHVVEGRGMSREAVEEVAQGRIWSGEAAAARGLVDGLGGLDLALARVREALGLAPDAALSLDYYPRPPTLFQFLAMDREYLWPVGLSALRRGLERRAPELLELPPDLARLSRPF